MRKAILMMLLAVVSNSAMAEWIELTSTEKETYYVNPATIRKKENIVVMWNVMNVKQSKLTKFLQELDNVLPNSDVKTVMSTVAEKEYDCKEGQLRMLKFSTHPKIMGEGEIITMTSNIGKWGPVVPGSIDESLWEYACDPCLSTGKYSGACKGMQ